jgi:HEAT repeat protein
MPAAAAPDTAPNEVSNAAVDAAFAALRAYDWGSSRAVLLPLDQAVAAAHATPAAREAMEQRLLTALRASPAVPAREYLCSQLALLGGKKSVPPLAALLGHPELATAARHALESIPHPHALKALRRALPKLSGREKTGVIISLGVKRDAASVAALAKLLADADPQTARAAAWALGEIATPAAARALGRWLSAAGADPRADAADAVLTCAERLAAAGRRAEAQTLCRALTRSSFPEHVRAAAERALKSASR